MLRAPERTLYNTRIGSRPLVIARDYHSTALHLEHVLIVRAFVAPHQGLSDQLTPVKDAIEHVWEYWRRIDTLDWPRDHLHVGLLASDSLDRTYERSLELADERQRRRKRSQRYGSVHVFRRDLLKSDEFVPSAGKDRHAFDIQLLRRTALAKSRSFLLSAALGPEIDWVLWLDVDVVDFKPSLIRDLIEHAHTLHADVIAPNVMWRSYNEFGGYDKNNWIETDASRALKNQLSPFDILVEGYPDHPTHRRLMIDMYTDDPKRAPEHVELDGVGGSCVLVRADVHRQGAVFPAVPIDHQLETEGFAQLAKALGARIIGLPTYHVFHGASQCSRSCVTPAGLYG